MNGRIPKPDSEPHLLCSGSGFCGSRAHLNTQTQSKKSISFLTYVKYKPVINLKRVLTNCCHILKDLIHSYQHIINILLFHTI